MLTILKELSSTKKQYGEQVTASQESSDTPMVIVAGSAIDVGAFTRIGISFRLVSGDAVNLNVYGALQSDFSDEVLVTGEALEVNEEQPNALWSEDAEFRYYRVKMNSKVEGDPGTVSMVALAR